MQVQVLSWAQNTTTDNERVVLPDARMAELVDAHVSGACIERCAGSSPVPGTKEILQVVQNERKSKIFFLLYPIFGHLLATFSRKGMEKGCRLTPLKHCFNPHSKQPIHSGTRHTVGIFIQTQFNVLVEHRLGLMSAHTHHLLNTELL